MVSIPHLIDPSTWKRAGWMAMAFMAPAGYPPTLAFVFAGERTAAAEIPARWKEALGTRDDNELLRVAIIEGVRGGQRGYFVHLSIDIDQAMAALSASEGAQVDLDVRALDGDVARWFPQRDPRPLEEFKQRFHRDGECVLIGATFEGGAIQPLNVGMLVKRRLVLRRLEDIPADPDDPDFPLLGPRS